MMIFGLAAALLLALYSQVGANEEISVNLPASERMDFVYVPPGTFTMGSAIREGRQPDRTFEMGGRILRVAPVAEDASGTPARAVPSRTWGQLKEQDGNR